MARTTEREEMDKQAGVYIAVYADGYILGASDDARAKFLSHWISDHEHEPLALWFIDCSDDMTAKIKDACDIGDGYGSFFKLRALNVYLEDGYTAEKDDTRELEGVGTALCTCVKEYDREAHQANDPDAFEDEDAE